jgi:serine protease AprX
MTLSPRTIVSALALGLFLAGTSVPAFAEGARSKLDKVLRAAERHRAQRVIIQTRAGSRAALKRALQQHGDAVEAEHPGLEALTVVVHGDDLAALERDPSVLAVSIDAEVTAFGRPMPRKAASRKASPRRPGRPAPVPAPRPAAQLLRNTLGVNGLTFSGAGVNVAVVDSGIDPTDDLAPRIAGFWDFTRGGKARRAYDDYGHGTHVAGLIASSGVESDFEFAGVAPRVRLYGFKVLDKDGRGRTSHVVDAIEFIVRSRTSTAPGAPKIDVLNLSLGHPIYEPAASDPLVRAVEKAVRAGIVVVTAAGNLGQSEGGDTGYTGITSPGNAPSAITVGASDSRNTQRVGDDRVAAFSSRGPTWFDGLAKPDLLAPGVALTSDAGRFSSLFGVFPELKKAAKNGRGTYGRLSGTSMASAVATGVAALVVEASRGANPGGMPLTPNALKAVLQYTAVPLENAAGEPYDALTQGTGGINARGAVAMALAIETATPAGAPWLRFVPEPYTVLGGAAAPWSRALLWDDNIVWGTDALSFNSLQWADNIVWGTALGADDNIVWGTAADVDNIVWGTSTAWAADLVWSNRVVGLMHAEDNIVWGTASGLDADNIVWGTLDGDNIVWGTWDDDNIVWGTSDVDNIVWGTFRADLDNIVWGTFRPRDNIVWGTSTGR